VNPEVIWAHIRQRVDRCEPNRASRKTVHAAYLSGAYTTDPITLSTAMTHFCTT